MQTPQFKLAGAEIRWKNDDVSPTSTTHAPFHSPVFTTLQSPEIGRDTPLQDYSERRSVSATVAVRRDETERGNKGKRVKEGGRGNKGRYFL